MTTLRDELVATVRELEAILATASPSMRPLIEQQIAALRHTIELLESVAPALAEHAQSRPPLSPEDAVFFRPELPAEVPSWIPDTVTRSAVSDALMRCPPGARVYAFEDSIGCALPRPGSSVPLRHGLQLWFHSNGRLRSQSYYEQSLSRWAIAYHLTGGRERVGWYADREPMVYLEHGLHTRFAPNGTIVAQAHYVAGMLSTFWQAPSGVSPPSTTTFCFIAGSAALVPTTAATPRMPIIPKITFFIGLSLSLVVRRFADESHRNGCVGA
jgi:hypothetical protein